MAFAALAPALIGAAGAIGGGFLSGRSQAPQETKIERKKRKFLDTLLSSLEGKGPFSDLYKSDEVAFQKSFVEPMQAKFRNQIAPQIQQQYIASGQQRGTGLDDQLLRAGVEMDQLLNSNYMEFINQAQNRKQNAISGVFGVPAGAQQSPTGMQTLGQSTAGYLSSPAFQDLLKDTSKNWNKQPDPYQTNFRKGFEQGY